MHWNVLFTRRLLPWGLYLLIGTWAVKTQSCFYRLYCLFCLSQFNFFKKQAQVQPLRQLPLAAELDLALEDVASPERTPLSLASAIYPVRRTATVATTTSLSAILATDVVLLLMITSGHANAMLTVHPMAIAATTIRLFALQVYSLILLGCKCITAFGPRLGWGHTNMLIVKFRMQYNL